MPHGTLKPHEDLEYLQILDKDGTVDDRLDPQLSDDLLYRLYRSMILSRRLDERMLAYQREGRIGTFGPARGQEAAQLGAGAALKKADWLVPSYRETTLMLWRGTPPAAILLYNAGYNEGGRIAEDRHDLPIAIPVGTQMLHAVGIAYAAKMRGEQTVVMTCFGDGATSQGDFHEAMNFATVFGVPVVFLCQNNQYAISVPRAHQTASKTLAQKALAYDIAGMQVDGNDILAVYRAANEAVERARTDNAPTLIECVTYRLGVHTTADDPTKYRSDDEVERWKAQEPLPRFQTYLKNKGLLDNGKIDSVEKQIKAQIDEAWTQAKERIADLTDASAMFDHLFEDLPPYVAAEREAVEVGQSTETGHG